MGQINDIIKGIDKNVLGILITSLIAFVSWIVKGLIEIPLKSSKDLFYKFFDKRVEVLADLKVRLAIIALFPDIESLEFKKQIQQILLNEGKAAYLDSNILADVISIGINEVTDEVILLRAISNINISLAGQIKKVEQSNNFFSKYSNEEPFKRIIGYFLLSLYYIIIVALVLGFAGIAIEYLIDGALTMKLIVMLVMLVTVYFLNKWIRG